MKQKAERIWQVRISSLLVAIAMLVVGCGDGSDDRTFGPSGTGSEETGAETESDSDSSSDSSEDMTEEEPMTQTFFFGEGGNLWKPEADPESSGAGNMVVLMDAMFSEQFDSCAVRKNTGELSQLLCVNDQPFTEIPFSCFSNGGRQTWRATFPCEEAAEVLVTCRLRENVYIFTVGEAARGQVCARFG